jgi:hypothetical protein
LGSNTSARHRDPLLLAARELGRPALPEIRELDHVERLLDPRFDLGRPGFAHLERERQVLVYRHVREQRVILEHDADVAPVRRDVADRPAIEDDLAMGHRLEAREHHQAGGLARAGRAEQGQELAARHVEIEAAHDQRVAVVGLLHVDESDVRLVLHPASSPRGSAGPPRLRGRRRRSEPTSAVERPSPRQLGHRCRQRFRVTATPIRRPEWSAVPGGIGGAMTELYVAPASGRGDGLN